MNNILSKITNRKEYRIFFYLLSFLIPIFAMLVICKKTDTYPIGNKSWLVCDMDNQYISYFSYFKHAVKENGFLYTFSKTMGGDMFGFTTYYLMSPLNFLLLLVNTNQIHDMVAWISIIKIALCGLNFFILANYDNEIAHSYSLRKSVVNLAFSVAYGLMTYNIFYISNIMWFDAIYMLPLVILGIHRVVNEKKYLLYIVVLAYSIITNFYIGYMVCIFSAIYFVYYFLFEFKGYTKEKLKIMILFTFSSLMAGGLSMWCLLPAKSSLAGIKAEFSLENLTINKNFFWSDFFVKLFPYSSQDLMAGLPNVYCGIVILFFSLVFFFCRKNTWKKKVGIAGLLLIMFFSFYIDGANLVWHGFNAPVGFPYRNSFLFSFILIWIAREGFLFCMDEKISFRLINGIISGAIIVILSMWMKSKEFEFVSLDAFRMSLVAILVGFIIIVSIHKRFTYVACALMFLFLLYETSLNGIDIFLNRESMILGYLDMSIDQVEDAVNLIKEEDDDFYRIEKRLFRNVNDNMMFGIPGLSHYSSTEKPFTKQAMQAFGYRNNGNWAAYKRGSTFSAESFLGVKYLLTQTNMNKPYRFVDKVDGTYILENPYAFSMAYLTDGPIEGIQIDFNNTFDFQNKVFECTSLVGDIFTREIDYTTTVQNMELLDGYAIYQKVDKNQDAFVEYSFVVKEDFPIYVYLNSIDMRLATIQINGVDTGKYFAVDQYDTISVNNYVDIKRGDVLTIRVTPMTEILIITDILIYYEDLSKLEQAYNYQKVGMVSLHKYTDSHLEGTFVNDKNRNKIFLSIPYDEGWKAYIDGNETTLYPITGAFMGIFGVESGEHVLTLQYVPKKLYLGMGISSICLCILLGLCVYECVMYKEKKLLRKILLCIYGIIGIISFYLLIFLICSKNNKPKVVELGDVEKEVITFGKFEQDGNIENGPEPLEWIVLAKEGGKAFVVSKYALTYLPYNVDDVVCLWEDSYVREWLNEVLYQSSFSNQEKERIILTRLDNSDSSSEYVEDCSVTEDYLFLLNRKEVKHYFGANTEITDNRFYSQHSIVEPTPFAVACSEEKNKQCYSITENAYNNVFKKYGYTNEVIGIQGCDYWLRNPGKYSSIYATTVGGNGIAFDIGTYISESAYVRPAMWINIE